MALLDDLDRRRESFHQTRENSARLASAYAQFTTNGQGTMHYDTRIDFGVLFIEKPFTAHACAVDLNDLADTLGLTGDNPDPPLPVVTGYVTEWDQDERDMYTGCWVSVRVTFPIFDNVDPTAPVSIEHHFTFTAIAMKDIPLDVEDAVDG